MPPSEVRGTKRSFREMKFRKRWPHGKFTEPRTA